MTVILNKDGTPAKRIHKYMSLDERFWLNVDIRGNDAILIRKIWKNVA